MTLDQKPTDRRWKFPIVPSVVRKEFDRPSPADCTAIADIYLPDLCDALGRMYTVAGLTSLFDPAIPVAGPAFTVKCPPGDNFALKIALTMTQPGDVLVVDAQGFSDWCLGGFQMLTGAIKERGLKGLIVNGAYRDRSEARAAGFPIYAKGMSPWSGPKLGPVEINVPVCCGGVIVNPGDVISASEDGIAVVPSRHLARVLDHFAAKRGPVETESQVLARLAAQDAANLDYLTVIADHAGVDFISDQSPAVRSNRD